VEILYLLIPLSVVLVLAIGAVFWWALESAQFEDLEGPAYRILMDDERGAAVVPVDADHGVKGAASDPKERQRLIDEHMKSMHESMSMTPASEKRGTRSG